MAQTKGVDLNRHSESSEATLRTTMENTVKQELETVIGLEVHLQLDTQTKIFCGCKNSFGGEPNTRTCPVCLGLPGALPVFNVQALNFAIKIALALNCQINRTIKFDRKNYYYPDLPKGYQISQNTDPIAAHGIVTIKTGDGIKQINIRRAHLEEDAGKLIHDSISNCSLVDYNRTCTPLMEIVTEPDLRSPQEAYDYLHTLKLILQYLDVSDCDMEKGSLRCDANISIREKGQTTLGTKTELKNMNSFKAVKTALEFEVNRQSQMLLAGERIIQETRLWDDGKQMTLLMRSKEEAHDYRYFPEPDLVPFTVNEETINEARKTLPELPASKLSRFIQQYELPEYDAQILIQDVPIANFFEESTKSFSSTKKISNWIIGPLQSELNARKTSVKAITLTAKNFTDLIHKVEDGVVSNLIGKDILKIMIEQDKTADQVITENGLAQVSDDATLEKAVDEIIAANPTVVEQIKQGKESAMGFLVGQTMKKTQGKANPKKVGDIIKRRLLNE